MGSNPGHCGNFQSVLQTKINKAPSVRVIIAAVTSMADSYKGVDCALTSNESNAQDYYY